MEETTSKKREWIKNAAIIFLAVMLLLTFFSNTIMNYSLPEVATSYVVNGSITSKIRGSGIIESDDPYSLMVTESREIASVLVKKDDHVEVGQTLFTLKDVESTELITAKDDLSKLKVEYQKSILNNALTRAEVNAIESGNVPSLQDNQSVIESFENRITAAEKELKIATNKVNEIQKKKDILDAATVDATAEKKALEKAEEELREAKTELERAQLKRDRAKEASDADPDNTDLKAAYNQAEKEFRDAEDEKLECEAAVNQAQAVLDIKVGDPAISNQVAALKKELLEAQEKQATLEASVKALTDERDEERTQILAKIDLAETYKAMQKKQEEVDKLLKNSVGAEITSPINGTITEISLTAGQKTSPDTAVAVLREDGKECTVSFPVTNEQAKKVNIGDMGELQNAWFYDDVTVTLQAIKPDSENPSKSKKLVFSVSGDVMPGQNLAISIGQRSTNYDLVVPNSAIREDKDGKFILIVESKSTPFGNRYIATKTEVEVLASDDNNTAISAPLYGYEYVLTTANKPVEPGDQVRLAE